VINVLSFIVSTASTHFNLNNDRNVFIMQDNETGEISFYMKGADVVMRNIVQYNDWMDEEVSTVICCTCHLSLLHVFHF
jgi:hypothetical protein